MVWCGVSVLKKFLFLLICCFTALNAQYAKAKLVENIIKVLFPDNKVALFVQDKAYVSPKESEVFTRMVDCQKADVMIVQSLDGVSKKCLQNSKYIIVTSYNSYKNHKTALGAIFWQKGRLNLIFRKEKLDELSLKLPKNYSKYIE